MGRLKMGVISDSEVITPDMLEEVKKALPELDKLIFKASGLKTKMQAKMDGKYLSLYSDKDYSQELGPMGKIIFSKVLIRFWGGQLSKEDGTIWFNPKVQYTHPSGGSNGSDFIWSGLWFDLAKKAWIEGRKFI